MKTDLLKFCNQKQINKIILKLLIRARNDHYSTAGMEAINKLKEDVTTKKY